MVVINLCVTAHSWFLLFSRPNECKKISVSVTNQYVDIISTTRYVSTKIRASKWEKVDWVAVGRRIRELRGFDLTQQQFATQIGISQNYLSYMERGKVEIGAEILLRIGREFGKTIEWLLTGQEAARQ
jgi:DNA-binding XRE family transcriptional regulator